MGKTATKIFAGADYAKNYSTQYDNDEESLLTLETNCIIYGHFL